MAKRSGTEEDDLPQLHLLGRNDSITRETSEYTESDLYGKVVKADSHESGGTRTGGPVRRVDKNV